VPRLRSGSTSRALDLSAGQLRELLRHAQECLPEECCGVLIGSECEFGRVRAHRVVAAANVTTRDRERHFEVDPLTILAADREARAKGLELVGYYHSHPSGSAAPSASDLRQAWPNTSYVILGMDGSDLNEIKSWRLVSDDTEFAEETLRCGEFRE